MYLLFFLFFFSSRRRHTRSLCDWSSDVCSSDLNSIGLDGMNQLILFRAMQGICGGMMMGLTFAIIGDIFSPAERGRYQRSEEHTSELQSHSDLVCRLLLEKKNNKNAYDLKTQTD